MPGIPDIVTMKLDHDLIKRLEERGRRLGLNVESYIAYVLNCDVRGIDREQFDPATRQVFRKHGEALRRLAERDAG